MASLVRSFAVALLLGVSTPCLAQAMSDGLAQPTGGTAEAEPTPPGAAATTHDPALTGLGEPPSGRDPAAAFSSGNAAAPAPSHSATLGPIGRFEQNNPFGNVLRDLKKDGISLTANYVGNLAANPVGGVRHGSAQSHWFDAGAEIDLGKLIGLDHTTLHIQGADFEGENLAATSVGSSISFQQTWRPVPGWRLTQLNIDHDFGKLNVMFGRAALNSYFGASPLNCVFMSNAACLTAYGPITAIGITAFPNSSWAGKLRYAFNDKVYAQIGVFDYNNNLNLAGKDGTDFSFFQGTGKLIAVETGYETTLANDRYPRRFRIGVDINTDPGTSPLYDRNGKPAGISGLARAEQTGTKAGIYVVADQTIFRAHADSPRNTAVFGRLFYNAGAKSTIDWFASAGIVKTGTFKGRDNDTLDFLISNTHFDSEEIEYLRELRMKAGGSGRPHANEIIGELNYGFAAAPGIRIMPNVQWEINPDPINATRYQHDIPSAIVVGLRFDIRFAQFLMGSSPVAYSNSKIY
jgi:porin